MARRRRGLRVSPAFAATAVVVAAAGLAIGLAVADRFMAPAPPPVAQHPAGPPPARVIPPPAPQPPVTRQAVPLEVRGRVAIIFDDAGGSLEDLDAIIAIGRPVTVAVLPGLKYSREVAERARAAGLEVILHLPVEPEDPTQELGPGGIRVSMSDEEIARVVRSDLASVPGAVGVNNHMGSKGTADPRVMRAVLAVVKERELIFVDSVTSSRTVAARVASEMGIRHASRRVFLDNEDAAEAIRGQLTRLIDLARRTGHAVAIGHAHRLTSQVVREMLGEFDTAGIELVPASTLAR